jgi:AAA+ superfamily predicted ATPase
MRRGAAQMGELEIESGARTLSARLAELDRRRFVGRVPELAMLERCLEAEPPFQIVLVHGPGGIGKSMLLRELGRRARTRGFELFALEGRDVTPTPDGIESLLAPARRSARPLITIDTFERSRDSPATSGTACCRACPRRRWW